ncbi:hypothetical protein GUITHDRAFT_114101 [Guillardia theta CCMP2712]|uniref:Uncharacterized protein n=4 Tax=Guillardia theta TaxID=55529 RepID=L1IUC9_GUITC|nr:hypothetical protein GUITHDRAFT_114101 [Guillardia theta CCMP2712]EKX39851.1 hypothetical protein GUITHDRAFT_114101 [Guillardia theta CCMP2712]|eukprot:XP_005826831.1 hypothetical protein GUITHDRAFT_114101 [Guillardia theta CCMP2712]
MNTSVDKMPHMRTSWSAAGSPLTSVAQDNLKRRVFSVRDVHDYIAHKNKADVNIQTDPPTKKRFQTLVCLWRNKFTVMIALLLVSAAVWKLRDQYETITALNVERSSLIAIKHQLENTCHDMVELSRKESEVNTQKRIESLVELHRKELDTCRTEIKRMKEERDEELRTKRQEIFDHRKARNNQLDEPVEKEVGQIDPSMSLDHEEVAQPQGTVKNIRSLSTGEAKVANMTSDSASGMPSAGEHPRQNGEAASESPLSDIHPQNFRSERDRRRADEREKSLKKRMLLNQARERMKQEASERIRREKAAKEETERKREELIREEKRASIPSFKQLGKVSSLKDVQRPKTIIRSFKGRRGDELGGGKAEEEQLLNDETKLGGQDKEADIDTRNDSSTEGFSSALPPTQSGNETADLSRLQAQTQELVVDITDRLKRGSLQLVKEDLSLLRAHLEVTKDTHNEQTLSELEGLYLKRVNEQVGDRALAEFGEALGMRNIHVAESMLDRAVEAFKRAGVNREAEVKEMRERLKSLREGSMHPLNLDEFMPDDILNLAEDSGNRLQEAESNQFVQEQPTVLPREKSVQGEIVKDPTELQRERKTPGMTIPQSENRIQHESVTNGNSAQDSLSERIAVNSHTDKKRELHSFGDIDLNNDQLKEPRLAVTKEQNVEMHDHSSSEAQAHMRDSGQVRAEPTELPQHEDLIKSDTNKQRINLPPTNEAAARQSPSINEEQLKQISTPNKFQDIPNTSAEQPTKEKLTPHNIERHIDANDKAQAGSQQGGNGHPQPEHGAASAERQQATRPEEAAGSEEQEQSKGQAQAGPSATGEAGAGESQGVRAADGAAQAGSQQGGNGHPQPEHGAASAERQQATRPEEAAGSEEQEQSKGQAQAAPAATGEAGAGESQGVRAADGAAQAGSQQGGNGHPQPEHGAASAERQQATKPEEEAGSVKKHGGGVEEHAAEAVKEQSKGQAQAGPAATGEAGAGESQGVRAADGAAQAGSQQGGNGHPQPEHGAASAERQQATRPEEAAGSVKKHGGGAGPAATGEAGAGESQGVRAADGAAQAGSQQGGNGHPQPEHGAASAERQQATRPEEAAGSEEQEQSKGQAQAGPAATGEAGAGESQGVRAADGAAQAGSQQGGNGHPQPEHGAASAERQQATKPEEGAGSVKKHGGGVEEHAAEAVEMSEAGGTSGFGEPPEGSLESVKSRMLNIQSHRQFFEEHHKRSMSQEGSDCGHVSGGGRAAEGGGDGGASMEGLKFQHKIK